MFIKSKQNDMSPYIVIIAFQLLFERKLKEPALASKSVCSVQSFGIQAVQ